MQFLHGHHMKTLIRIKTADERVPPSYSYEFSSQLQYYHPNNSKPLLMYVVKNRGHVPSNVLESVYQFCIIEQSLGITRLSLSFPTLLLQF